MTVTDSLAAPVELRCPPLDRPSPPSGTLELEVQNAGDPVRTALILATVVNNSPMALARATVGAHTTYPVPVRAPIIGGPDTMVLLLRMRDRSRHVDGLLVAELVELVSTVRTVVQARTRP